MKLEPTTYAVPTCELLDNEFNLDHDFWMDDSYYVYNDLKEQTQERIASAKNPSELIRYTKLLLYVEHRAMREHNLCV